ncbi:hypothetical protein MTR_5g096730 [Medicago truncatula]|uniref:Uncharacterized protein n=1 Tax=Medicago truncatula TaxID=3880 RepID=G7K4U0_MEDTR|nr:hypothetical protein MTR_5g096730 [Medicago truncatula]
MLVFRTLSSSRANSSPPTLELTWKNNQMDIRMDARYKGVISTCPKLIASLLTILLARSKRNLLVLKRLSISLGNAEITPNSNVGSEELARELERVPKQALKKLPTQSPPAIMCRKALLLTMPY